MSNYDSVGSVQRMFAVPTEILLAGQSDAVPPGVDLDELQAVKAMPFKTKEKTYKAEIGDVERHMRDLALKKEEEYNEDALDKQIYDEEEEDNGFQIQIDKRNLDRLAEAYSSILGTKFGAKT